MGDDNSQYRRGQIAGLQHICALLLNHLVQTPAGRADFARFLGDFQDPQWEGADSDFLDGLTNSFPEVSLHILGQ